MAVGGLVTFGDGHGHTDGACLAGITGFEVIMLLNIMLASIIYSQRWNSSAAARR